MIKNDNMILGENCIYSTDCNKTGINNNVIVVGGSGSGKTMSIVEPCLLNTFSSSIVVTLTKRKVADKYKKVFKKRGYEVFDLNFVNPDQSDVGYDPLAYIQDGNEQDIRFLAQSIIMADGRKKKTMNADPYWDESAISLLSAEISLVLKKKKNPTFTDVLELNDKLKIREGGGQIETSLDFLFDEIERENPHCFTSICWQTFSQLPIKTAGCVFSTLNTTIDSIFNAELRQLMKKSKKVDLTRMALIKSALFITTSPVNSALNCFVNTFYGQIFKQLFEFAESLPGGALPVPIRIFCDDFATGGRILNFTDYISILREKRVSVTILLQSESQLEGMYGAADATTIINNCDTYVYTGGMDIQTSRNISIRLNLPIEEVLYMPIGQEFIFRRGQHPIITKRYDILHDKTYQKITKQYERGLDEI